jgi:hypothetical protein
MSEIAMSVWQALSRVYHFHHFECQTCIAAGGGYGQRCSIGAPLWSAYQECRS